MRRSSVVGSLHGCLACLLACFLDTEYRFTQPPEQGTTDCREADERVVTDALNGCPDPRKLLLLLRHSLAGEKSLKEIFRFSMKRRRKDKGRGL